MVESALTIDLTQKVSPAILARIFDCNVSLIYQDVQKGRLPNIKDELVDYSYLDCIQFYRKYLVKNEGVKIAKVEQEARVQEAKIEADLKHKESKLRAKEKIQDEGRGGRGSYSEDAMQLIDAKTKQDIRVAVAREQQLWVRTQVERGNYLSVTELLELCEPILGTVRQTLLSLANESDESQKAVDAVMEDFHRLGVILVDQSKVDAEKFIEKIMETDIDISQIEIEHATEPKL